jgi:chromosome partitioning protein
LATSNQRGLRVIAVANQKGGAGKTTVAVNLAVAVGETGRRALLVDVDPQADATTMLGVDPHTQKHSLYDVLTGGCEIPGAIASDVAPGVDLVVGTDRMADVELTLAGQMMRERYLDDALREHVTAYDIVLIDCPPNLGLLTVNALVAATEVLVVVSMIDRNAYKGAIALLETIAELRRKGVHLEVGGILRNNVDRARQTYRALNDVLTGHTDLPVLQAQIPMRAEFQNALTAGQPLLRRNPDHIGAAALRRAAAELFGPALPDRRAA